MKGYRNLLHLLYLPYKWLFYVPFFFLNTIFFGLAAVLFSILINKKTGSYIGGVLWSRFNCFLVPVSVKLYGKEKITPGTSYIIIANHQSVFDIFSLYGWIGLDVKWVMKKNLKKIPGVGWGSKKVGHIFLDRSNKRAAVDSLTEAKKRLVNGTSIVMFPEGTRSTTGIPGKFKRGAFKLALDLNLPLLPVTIIGSKEIMSGNAFDIFPGKIRIHIHAPIDVEEYDEGNMSLLIQKSRETICSVLPPTN